MDTSTSKRVILCTIKQWEIITKYIYSNIGQVFSLFGTLYFYTVTFQSETQCFLLHCIYLRALVTGYSSDFTCHMTPYNKKAVLLGPLVTFQMFMSCFQFHHFPYKLLRCSMSSLKAVKLSSMSQSKEKPTNAFITTCVFSSLLPLHLNHLRPLRFIL